METRQDWSWHHPPTRCLTVPRALLPAQPVPPLPLTVGASPPPPPPESTSASTSQSDSEALGGWTQRWSLMRYGGNSLTTSSSSMVHHQSDLSTSTLPISLSKLPLSQPEVGTATSPGAPCQRPPMPQTSLMASPPTEVPPCGFNGCPASSHPRRGHSPTSEGVPVRSGGGELLPVPLGRSEGGGMGFSVTAGGKGGQLALVKRVWDRRQCSSLQPGDAIVKIDGADVQSLSFAQVQRVLQEHIKQGEVTLLVYRGGSFLSPVSPNLYKPFPSPLGPSSPSHGLPSPSDLPSTSDALVPLHLPPSNSGLAPASPSTELPSLVQSTSFLDSVPVTITLEPRDWLGMEEGGGPGPPAMPPGGGGRGRVGLGAMAKGPVDGTGGRARVSVMGQEVELQRRPGEGFGFVIASQDLANGASPMLSHRFVTVRRGSPAARSGQIQPGDQLEAVEGRSVVTLPHRDLSQIMRRAGNTLRLTIIPRLNTNSSNLSEGPELEADGRTRKSHRRRPKVRLQQDQRYYSVDLERGPTGFGFSLRGGSEYNMDLYVLGLMEGGPASRSHKIQVSDQLVEINGDSTTGMTHSQAVEQIRRGGHRIHLVLKKGNGYVPDYDHDPRSVSFSLYPEDAGVAAVDKTRSLPRKSERVNRGEERQSKGGSLGGTRSRGGARDTPDTDLDWPEEEGQVVSHRGQSLGDKDNGKRTQSLPKNRQEVEEEEEEVRPSEAKQRSKQQRIREMQSKRKKNRRERGDETEEFPIRNTSEGKREGGRRERERKTEVEDSGPAERVPFSFLKPLQDGEAELSNAESGVTGTYGDSFSDQVSLSAASVFSSTAQDPRDQRGDPWSTQSWLRANHASHTPGPWSSTQPQRATYNSLWIKPDLQMSQVLVGHRLTGNRLRGCLDL
ncbi:membrane-associated guanylate kinase, WW and PDZ domain-containing protein 1 isoform X1 [Salmo salar]|uniref:Membrane-associated guanylate kinase, WW and PDZ domain-containing protein 1 isoform X1 n=1 Tax=Salmo salar TaxID=8030 RepID=A0ABM3CQF8_SALSA|nr:membrane-associated guanylate kinase, WW and PDZ domain-containing protein 1-like isoform X1 [Salmo salar]